MLILPWKGVYSQWVDCSPPPISYIDNNPSYGGGDVDFTIDSFSKMLGGMVSYGSTMLYVNINEANPGLCQWKLDMIIDNSGFADNTVWNPVATYSTSATYPKIYMLKVKVSNTCGTPYKNDVWQNFVLDGASLPIIKDIPCNLDPVAGCPANDPCQVADAPYQKQVNTPGGYLTFWDQYSFKVDYCIYFSPNNPYNQVDVLTEMMNGYTPGLYKLTVKFKLTEAELP